MNLQRPIRVGSWVVAAVVGITVTGRTVSAEDRIAERPSAETKSTFQKQSQAARQTVRQLNLTRRQARRLLPIVEEAAALQVAAYEEAAALLPDMGDALEAFASEVSLGQGLRPEIERRTRRLNNALKNVRYRLDESLIELEAQAAEILSHRQQQVGGWEDRDPPGPRRRGFLAAADPLVTARQELRRINQRKHPTPGKLGRNLLHPAAGAALCEVTGDRLPDTIATALSVLKRGTSAYPTEQFDEQRAGQERLRAEIKNWNLINGLHLGTDQIEQIVAIGNRTEPQSSAVRPKDKLRLRAAREREVEKVLNPGQRQVVADFVPCLIPKQDLKNPVRVGQANDHSAIERWLERARTASRDRLDALIAQALEHEAKRYGQLSAADKRTRENLLRRTARQVAAMTDVDFELAKAALAEQIAPRDRSGELLDEIAALSRSRNLPGAVNRYMLNPQFLEQVSERGRELAGGSELKRANLAKGPQAENCDKSCALPRSKSRKGKHGGR